MGARILINEGANQLVIDKRALFRFRRVLRAQESGDIDKMECFLDIYGDEIQSTPGALWTAIWNKDNQAGATANLGPQRVQIELDGSNYRDFKPSECINSPIITGFELEPDLEGLLHVSELADHKVENPQDEVKIGDELDVKILRVDIMERKIGLSRKRAKWAEGTATDVTTPTAEGADARGRERKKRRGGLHGPGEEQSDVVNDVLFKPNE